MSEMRKQQNRLKFGEEAEVEIEAGVGLGMLSQGTGKLKVNIKKNKLKLSKKLEMRAGKKSGLESSLNLNATQGIELINPAQQQQQQNNGKSSYFGK
jgi:U4/U6 small nuclear ribonucleoprotein PRP31